MTFYAFRNFVDKDDGLGTSDPYVEVFLVENGKENKIGKSDVISNSENPDWGTVFEFEFVRDKRQVRLEHSIILAHGSLASNYFPATPFKSMGRR